MSPPIHHPKLTDPNLGLHHIYNVVTNNRFAALYNVHELEDIGSTSSRSQFQKKKVSEDRWGIKVPVNKKTDLALMAASKSSDIVVTLSDMSTVNSSMVNLEIASTQKKVHKDQVC